MAIAAAKKALNEAPAATAAVLPARYRHFVPGACRAPQGGQISASRRRPRHVPSSVRKGALRPPFHCHPAARQLRLDTGRPLPDDEIQIRNQLLMTMGSCAGGRGVLYRPGKHPLHSGGGRWRPAGVARTAPPGICLAHEVTAAPTPRPRLCGPNFEKNTDRKAQAATDGSTAFSQDTTIYRCYRIKRDLKVTDTLRPAGYYHVSKRRNTQGHCRRHAYPEAASSV